MWISDKWQDYELIDASDGQRLERWGEYTLVRPRPAGDLAKHARVRTLDAGRRFVPAFEKRRRRLAGKPSARALDDSLR